MRLLAIDVGDTTGWCLFRDGEVEDHGHFQFEAQQALPAIWYDSRRQPDKVVVEPPIMRTARWRLLVTEIRNRFDYWEVRPADWKPRFGKARLPAGVPFKTQHEKDACRIGLYALHVLEREEERKR